MKKLIIGAFALMLGAVFTSCNQKNQSAADQEAVADTVPTMQLVEKEKPIVNPLEEVVIKAQNEGAQWNEAQWKEAYKQMLTVAKPTLMAMQEITKKIDENPNNDAVKEEVTAQFREMIYQFDDANAQMTEFRKAANATASGKAALSDQKWINEVLKELGLPESI
jgi:hypothetical protein